MGKWTSVAFGVSFLAVTAVTALAAAAPQLEGDRPSTALPTSDHDGGHHIALNDHDGGHHVALTSDHDGGHH